MTRRISLALAPLLLLSAVACETAAGERGERLRVFAASSLTDVLPRIDDRPLYQFAGSDELALQIREGAEADVFAAASSTYPLELHDESLVEEPVVFATNRLVLIVPSDNPAGIGSVADLRSDVSLVVGAAGVPVGDYTREVLENLGLSDVLEQVVSEEQEVKGVVGKVRLGEADAGFVYATDALSAGGEIETIELPAAAQPRLEYSVAVVTGGVEAEADAFIRKLLSERAQTILRAAGFGSP